MQWQSAHMPSLCSGVKAQRMVVTCAMRHAQFRHAPRTGQPPHHACQQLSPCIVDFLVGDGLRRHLAGPAG
eukprot:13966-Chlamydomonas_euryale.AAC.4